MAPPGRGSRRVDARSCGRKRNTRLIFLTGTLDGALQRAHRSTPIWPIGNQGPHAYGAGQSKSIVEPACAVGSLTFARLPQGRRPCRKGASVCCAATRVETTGSSLSRLRRQQRTAESIVWFDLLNPTPEEDRLVEQPPRHFDPDSRRDGGDRAVGPPLSRGRRRVHDHDGGRQARHGRAGQDARNLHPERRQPRHRPLRRAEALCDLRRRARSGPNGLPCASGEQVMLGLLEAIIDRIADALESVGTEVDGISREVFRNKASQRDQEDPGPSVAHRADRPQGRLPDHDPREPGQHRASCRLPYRARGHRSPGRARMPAEEQAHSARCAFAERPCDLPVEQDQLSCSMPRSA